MAGRTSRVAGLADAESAPQGQASPRMVSRWKQVLCVLGVVAGAASMPAAARSGPDGLPTVSLEQLPREALHTHRLVLSGGPFPYEKDGTVFGNRERLLPKHPRGYYREYTVRTPGAKNRGARRLVCGGEPPSQPEVCYYTADHYASFSRIVP